MESRGRVGRYTKEGLEREGRREQRGQEGQE